MPLYDYRCATCGKTIEVRHGFNDSYAEPCASCGGQLGRVFNPAPIVFKGSGFYVTDSRSKSEPKSESKSESKSDSKTESSSSSSSTGDSAA